jgi:UDP-glucuronate decarboxylase
MSNPIVVEDLTQIRASVDVQDRLRDAVVLVTGCAGFVGFYLMQFLVRYAAELGIRKVIGLDTFLLDRPRWLIQLAERYPDKLALHEFNIAASDLGNIAGSAGARFVIHMASIASPTFYRRYPLETVDANIWGLRQLLDFYRDSSSLEGLLFLSSSEIYGDPEASAIPTPEDYRGNVACVGPRACYDEAKRFGETLCYIFANSYSMPITVARPFNNYGPGMRLDDRRLAADFARCVLERRDIVILSDGSPTRTFCYIADAVTGYLKCLLHGRFDSFNIGIERPEVSVREVAQIFQNLGKAICGYRGTIRFEQSRDKEYLTDNPNRRCPVIAKACEQLGYEPKILVEEGVERYLKFLRFEQVPG